MHYFKDEDGAVYAYSKKDNAKESMIEITEEEAVTFSKENEKKMTADQ